MWGQGWEGVKEEEQTTEMTKLKKIKNKTNLKIPLIHIFFVNIIALQTQKRGSSGPKETNYTSNPPHHPSMTA